MIPVLCNASLETRKSSLQVLIIGGGIGGLCLAQGLKKSGIKVAVYERDESADFRDQGYRITLKAEGSHALRDCLPEPLFQLCVATALKSATHMVFLDHQLKQKFIKPIPSLPDDSFFGVNRLTLREILLIGLEDIVHFGKTFERFEQLDDGKVCARFTDGTSATGDLLVGADGTNSVVRKQVIPDAEIDQIGSFIYGKTPLTSDTLAWVPDMLIDSFNRITGPVGVSMSVATCWKREAYASATAMFAPNRHLTVVPDYLAWMLDGPQTQLASTEEQGARVKGPMLHRLAQQMLKEWPPSLRRIVEEATVADTFLVNLHSSRPVKSWQTRNVTLLGDAIHTMSPGRGEGANTALRDAESLRQVLVEVVMLGKQLVQAKVQYEAAMLRYGFEAVANALEHPFAPTSNTRGRSRQRSPGGGVE
ncbi:FAD-dependent oxidoreductase [Ktedonospora formicarum]|nr:NAD(P)/FAD-dependent oxidoreductase [Ktedonospora formicarum]